MALTRDAFPPLFYLRVRISEGNLGDEDGVFLPLDEGLLLLEGDGLSVASLL